VEGEEGMGRRAAKRPHRRTGARGNAVTRAFPYSPIGKLQFPSPYPQAPSPRPAVKASVFAVPRARDV
jgi:hypothetical protein